MANVHLWGRLSHLWQDFVGLWLEDVEKNRPEIGYEQAVQSMSDKVVALKGATTAILGRGEELLARLEEGKRELARMDSNRAVDGGTGDPGATLVQEKRALEASVHELTADLQQTEAEADAARSSLLSVKPEIERLLSQRDRILAKVESAQARLKLQRQLQSLSVDAAVRALECMRTPGTGLEGQAKLSPELEKDEDGRTR